MRVDPIPDYAASRLHPGYSISPLLKQRHHERRERGREHAKDDRVGARSADHIRHSGELFSVAQMHGCHLCAGNPNLAEAFRLTALNGCKGGTSHRVPDVKSAPLALPGCLQVIAALLVEVLVGVA